MSLIPLIHQMKTITKSLDKNKLDADNLFEGIIEIRKQIEQSINWLDISGSSQPQPIDIGNKSNANKSSIVIEAIQNESTKVHKLRRKNQILRQQLQEYEFSLELIMFKYRQLILLLLQKSKNCNENIMRQNENHHRNHMKSEVIKSSVHIQKIIELFNEKISDVNVNIILKQIEKLEQLRIERNGLIELLKISKQFGSLKILKEKKKNKNEGTKE